MPIVACKLPNPRKLMRVSKPILTRTFGALLTGTFFGPGLSALVLGVTLAAPASGDSGQPSPSAVDRNTDLVVVGAGLAGLSAALEAGRHLGIGDPATQQHLINPSTLASNCDVCHENR
jgi:hypothetical protein